MKSAVPLRGDCVAHLAAKSGARNLIVTIADWSKRFAISHHKWWLISRLFSIRLGESWTSICQSRQLFDEIREVPQSPRDDASIHSNSDNKDPMATLKAASQSHDTQPDASSECDTAKCTSSNITNVVVGDSLDGLSTENRRLICAHNDSNVADDASRDESSESSDSWPRKKAARTSIADLLPPSSYLFKPPSRYVFPGAEVYERNGQLISRCYSSDEEDSDDDDEDNSCSTSSSASQPTTSSSLSQPPPVTVYFDSSSMNNSSLLLENSSVHTSSQGCESPAISSPTTTSTTSSDM